MLPRSPNRTKSYKSLGRSAREGLRAARSRRRQQQRRDMEQFRREDERARAAVRRRKPLVRKPPKEGTRRWYEEQLESVTAQIVKMRDGFECQQCKADGVRRSDILDAGHVYPKGEHEFKGGRFLLENIFAQCRGHNTIHVGRPEYMMNWHIATFGPEAHEELHKKVLQPAPSLEDMKTLLAEREQLRDEMRMHLEAMV